MEVVVLADEFDGGFVASIVELPGIAGQGDTFDSAFADLIEAVVAVIDDEWVRQREQRR